MIPRETTGAAFAVARDPDDGVSAVETYFTNVYHEKMEGCEERCRSVWDTIPLEGRCALIDCCREAADREHWD